MDDLWRTSDWLYHAEGGKHAIFRYRPSIAENPNDCLVGHMLRITKHDLALANAAVLGVGPVENNLAAKTGYRVKTVLDLKIKSFLFQKSIVQPLLGPCYLDLPCLALLPAVFCAKLYQHAMASGNIPSSRLQSWETENSNRKCKVANEAIRATLLRDHTTLVKHPCVKEQPIAKQHVMSVEIKPKAGYITSSPLVSPLNRCKFNCTRYSLQQQLMEKGHIQKGWRKNADQHDGKIQKSKPFISSSYSPIDLFSGDALRIRTALVDLSSNMQNNFRAFYNGRQIFGEDIISPSEGEMKDILDALLLQSGSSTCDKKINYYTDSNALLLDLITSVVSRILHRENLLKNLQTMQLLDTIDGDGAIRVYDRLVHLCNGSNSQAEEILDDAMLCIDEKKLTEPIKTAPLCGNNRATLSPYELPNCPTLHKLVKEIDGFRPNSNIDLNATHETCVQLVDQLSKEGCIYLLQNWLLSLAMCDVSFFVTFQCIDDEGFDREDRQSTDHPGVMLYDRKEEPLFDVRTMIQYEVKVIDCDAKPAKKLRSRTKVEDPFQFIAA